MVSQLLSLLFSLGLLLLLPAGAQPTAIQELYVKPTEDTSCPEPCHTLDEYVQHATQYFVSNTVFKFLPGTHDLSQSLNVTGVSNLAMVAHSNGSEAKISCSDVPNLVDIKYCNLSFTDISNLTLEGLMTSNCILRLIDILNLNLVRIRMELQPRIHDCLLDSVTIVSAENTVGNSSIIIGFGLDLPATGFSYDYCSAPPLLVVSFNDRNFSWPLPSHNQLTIKNSDVSVPFQPGNSIELNQSTYNVSIVFDNVTTSSPDCNERVTVRIGSAAHNTITVKNLQFSSTASQQLTVADHLVSGTSNSNTIVHISDCWLETVSFSIMSTQVIFEDSFVYYVDSVLFKASGCDITVKNVTFTDIQSYHFPLSSGTDGLVQISCGTNISFINCKFHNLYGTEDLLYRQGLPIVSLANSRGINFTDCDFSNNRGTAIHSFDSSYTLSGSNTFSNNSAYRGGAMAFYGQSYVTFSDGSSAIFDDNSADTVGGAIYVDYGINNPCFVLGDICNYLMVKLKFGDNEVKEGGERVYGASFDTCSNSNHCHGSTIASILFDFDPKNTTDFSAIASDPLRACLCEDGRPSCTTVFSNHTHYPGETFNISAVVVGDRFGTVDGSVYAQLLPVSGRVAELGSLQSSQRVEHSQCTNVSYTVFSNGSSEAIILTARIAQIQSYPNEESLLGDSISDYDYDGTITNSLRTLPVYINITLLPCPLGFMLSGQFHGCICDTQLQNNHIHCDLSTQTVQRSGTEWVKASFHSNNSNGVIVSKYCPNDYCKPETVNVNLEYPDTQCAFNHSGILCGGCQSGLSRALGSPQCLSSCSNGYLALLIPFALAGFVLVFFIKLLNLTVAQGTLNGLIFYANIVRAYQVAWIPGYRQNILTVFIAWLNLDLGIETCFFNGLDAYLMTWLQFVFPLYIWAIAILIIILSHYFSTAAKIFGSNSVPTLATLFLLSYPKLLRTIISIFQYSTLDHPDGISETRWSYDGNISYHSPMLVPLFLTAATAVLFLWLPYTGILLFTQCLQRSSSYRVGKVLAKLKPFLDAYFGPLKDEHRYWVGVLLLVRGALFITFAATSTRNSEVAVLIALIAVLCVMLYLAYVGRVYKKSYLNLLENSFFLNLATLAAGTLYAGMVESALAYTSVSIAFAQFAVIVIFHSIIRLKETWLARKLHQVVKPARPPAVDEAVDESGTLMSEPVENRAGAQQLVVTYSNFREPVLKYLD